MILNEMRHLMNELLRMKFNLERVRSEAESCTQQITDMPKGGGVLRDMYDKVTAIMMAEEKIKVTEKELKERVAVIEPKINRIEDPEIRQIMRMRYIEGWSAANIAIASGYSKMTVYRKLETGESLVKTMT